MLLDLDIVGSVVNSLRPGVQNVQLVTLVKDAGKTTQGSLTL